MICLFVFVGVGFSDLVWFWFFPLQASALTSISVLCFGASGHASSGLWLWVKINSNKQGFRPLEAQIELMLFVMANNTIKANNLQPLVELHCDGKGNLYQRKQTFLKLC